MRKSPGCETAPPALRRSRCCRPRACSATRGRPHPRPRTRSSWPATRYSPRVVRDAGIGLRVVDAHERLAAAVHEHGHGPLRLVGHEAPVDAARIDRPRLDLGEAMAGGETHRVLDARIVPDTDARVAPPVEAVPHVASIAQRDVLLEHRAAGPQPQFDRPLHSVNPVALRPRWPTHCRPGFWA